MSQRSTAEMADYRAAIIDEITETHPQSVRHVFYRMVVLGLRPKTEAGYNCVGRELTKMRRDGRVPFEWITDDGRRVRQPWSSTSLGHALEAVARQYRRDIWADSEKYIEVWCESVSSAGLIESVTEEYGVPLCPCSGFSSVSFLWEAGQRIALIDRPVHLLYFGDWDPSGEKIEDVVNRDIRTFAPDAEIHFERIGVTPLQIKKMKLPRAPYKGTNNPHAKDWKGPTTELEAIPVPVLLDLVRDCITENIDLAHTNSVAKAEEADRKILEKLAREYG